MSYLNDPIERINNENKSCKVIEVNPPSLSWAKFPTLVGHQGYKTLLENSALVSYCQVENQYK